MGKKSDRRENEEILKVRIFQWEFLRRNPLYKQDYECLIEAFGGWFEEKGYWYDRRKAYWRSDFVFFINKICPVLKEICERWQITDPYSPVWVFDPHGFKEYAPGAVVYVPTGESVESAGHLWDYGPIELVKQKGRVRPFESRFRPLLGTDTTKVETLSIDKKAGSPRYLQITLDATLSTRELVRDVKKRVEFHRRRHDDFFSMHSQGQSRRRLDQYPSYLEVWDLRLSKKTFAEIARKMYPKEYTAYPVKNNPLVQRVIDHYARARELINGGYKELR